VEPLCEGMDAKLAEWGTDVAKTRELCLAITNTMAKHGNKCVHTFLLWIHVTQNVCVSGMHMDKESPQTCKTPLL
jgi:hypothetical protein